MKNWIHYSITIDNYLSIWPTNHRQLTIDNYGIG